MMSFRQLLLLVFFLTFGRYEVYSQQTNEVQDSARSFDQSKIKVYKENSTYLFHETISGNNKSRIFRWLTKKLDKIFDQTSPDKIAKILQTTFTVILWSIGLFAISMIIFTLYKANLKVLPRADTAITLDYQQLEKKIDTDFQPLIEHEIAEQRFNVALRLLFLQTIQLLHQHKHILWEKDKTNRDYLRELRNNKLQEPFSHLVKFYNFGWFGDYNVDKQEFTDIHSAFETFNTSIQ